MTFIRCYWVEEKSRKNGQGWYPKEKKCDFNDFDYALNLFADEVSEMEEQFVGMRFVKCRFDCGHDLRNGQQVHQLPMY